MLLANGKRQEIQFSSELNDYREKIINMIFVRQGGDTKLSTLSYEQYCRLVFDEEEATAQEKKKMIMKLSWQFLIHESVISQPSLASSRWRKMSLENPGRFPTISLKASAAGSLRRLDFDQIEIHTESIQNLAERGKIPMDVLSFFKHSLEFDQVIRVEKKSVKWNWDATMVLFFSGLQLMAGIFSACPALIHQGINDMVFLAMSVIRGDISIENYCRYKRMAIATAALTAAAKPVVNWVIESADKLVQNTAQHLGNSSLPQSVISTTADVLQTGSSSLSFAQKMVNAVPAAELVSHTYTPVSLQFVGALKQASSQIATQATMEYLTTTFCPDDVDRNVRKTIGEQLQVQVNESAQEIKKICMTIFEYSESPEQAEKIVQFLFETTLNEHHQKRQNPMDINMSLFSTEGMGKVFANEVLAQTGNGFLASLTGFTIANLDKAGAIKQAIFGAESFMKEVKKNAANKRDKLQSTKKLNKRTEKESADFAKFLDEEIQRLKIKIGNESLNVMGNTVLKPAVSWAWDSAIDFVSKGAKKANVEKVDQGDESNENKNSASPQILEGENAQFPKTLLEVRIVEEHIGGTTGAKIVEDQKGNKYVWKKGTSQGHLLSEYATNQAYKALGIDVPEAALYDLATGKQIKGIEQLIYKPVMLSKFVEGQELETFLEDNKLQDKDIKDIIKKGFVADCLLSNRDLVGLFYDNILFDPKKKIAWRVDCGGCLDYHARGAEKDEDELTPIIQEFERYRDPEINHKTANIFNALTNKEIVDQIEDILPRRESFLAAIPDHLKEIMMQRFDYLSVYRAKLTSPDHLLHDVWQGKQISGKELFNATKKLQSEWNKQTKNETSILTTISLLYEKAAEKFIEEGKIKEAFITRRFSAEAIQMPETHPLYNMDDAVDKGTKEQPDPSFGAFFSHLGGAGDLKLGHMRVFNEEGDHRIVFKITQQSRHKLEKTIELINKNLRFFKSTLPKDLQKFSLKKGAHCFKATNIKGSLSNSEKGYKIEEKVKNAWKINIPDVLNVTIVKNPELGCLYNNISLEINSKLPNEKKLEIFHQLFTMLGLGSIVCPKRPEDEERIKIAQLFRTFYPKEALKIEQAPEFYETPVEKLKKQIVDHVSDMEKIFSKYLVESPELLKKDVIYPGKNVWSVSDLSDQMREAGAYGLFATITPKDTYREEADIIVSILKRGALSTQDRFETGLFIKGFSSDEDLKKGGGDYVFTRLCTEKTETNFSWVCAGGGVAMLVGLDAVNGGGCYGYENDHYGVKNSADSSYRYYEERSNLIDFAKNLTKKNNKNELMIKNRIRPEDIKGLVVKNEYYKNALKKKLILAGIESFNGKKLDDFIHIAGQPAQQELWN